MILDPTNPATSIDAEAAHLHRRFPEVACLDAGSVPIHAAALLAAGLSPDLVNAAPVTPSAQGSGLSAVLSSVVLAERARWRAEQIHRHDAVVGLGVVDVPHERVTVAGLVGPRGTSWREFPWSASPVERVGATLAWVNRTLDGHPGL